MSTFSSPLRQVNDLEGASVALPAAKLQILRGWARYKTRPIAIPVFLIGSGVDCDLVLGDLQFPEVYCYIFLDATGVSVRWLGEGPQLLVDEEPVQSSELSAGCVLRMGSYEFALSVSDVPTDENSSAGDNSSVVDHSAAGDSTSNQTMSELPAYPLPAYPLPGNSLPAYPFPNTDLSVIDSLLRVGAQRVGAQEVGAQEVGAQEVVNKLVAEVLAVTCIREREQVRELLRDVRRVIGENVDLRLYVEPEIPALDLG